MPSPANLEQKDRFRATMLALHKLVRERVLVGIPEFANERKDGDFGNAAIGYISENGSPVKNIPARPWLVPGVRKAAPDIANILKQAAVLATKRPELATSDIRREKVVEPMLIKAGEAAVGAVTQRILGGIPPALKAATIAKRKGHTQGTTPLVDTGEFLHAITYVIDDGRKRIDIKEVTPPQPTNDPAPPAVGR